MPVFLSPSTAATWLDPTVSFGKAIGPVLRTAQEHARRELCMYEVSNLVSNVRNESPDCVLPKKEMDAKQFSKGLRKFFTKKAQNAADVEEKQSGKRELDCKHDETSRPPEKRARSTPAE